MSTEGAGASIPSRRTPMNEDAYLVHDGLGLYVVADGASYGPAGEVASTTAVNALEEFLENEQRLGTRIFRSLATEGLGFKALRHAMRSVLHAVDEHPDLDGMATTVTLLLIHEEHAVACHVGDSRLYLLRHGILRQLTSDDEWTHMPFGRSTDVYDQVSLESFSLRLHHGDIFLLCTDGAEDVVEDPRILRSATDSSPRELASRIVESAHTRDPDRDATVVVVRVRDDEEVGWLLVSRPVRPWAFGQTADLSYT